MRDPNNGCDESLKQKEEIHERPKTPQYDSTSLPSSSDYCADSAQHRLVLLSVVALTLWFSLSVVCRGLFFIRLNQCVPSAVLCTFGESVRACW
jgi:hypothetical protein